MTLVLFKEALGSLLFIYGAGEGGWNEQFHFNPEF